MSLYLQLHVARCSVLPHNFVSCSSVRKTPGICFSVGVVIYTLCSHPCLFYHRPRAEESDEEYAATERDSEMEDETTIAEQEDHEKATDYTSEISALQQEGLSLQTSDRIKMVFFIPISLLKMNFRSQQLE